MDEFDKENEYLATLKKQKKETIDENRLVDSKMSSIK